MTVHYEMQDGGWIATAPDGVVAFGRTLEKARENVVRLLAKAMRTYPGRIAVDDVVAIRASARTAVDEAKRTRSEALRAEAEAAQATRRAAKQLHAAGLSLRDAAYLLGVSHARVHQLLDKDD